MIFSNALICANWILKVLMLIASNMIQQMWASSPIQECHQVQSVANKWKIGFCKCNQLTMGMWHLRSQTHWYWKKLGAIGALLFCTSRALQHQACVFFFSALPDLFNTRPVYSSHDECWLHARKHFLGWKALRLLENTGDVHYKAWTDFRFWATTSRIFSVQLCPCFKQSSKLQHTTINEWKQRSNMWELIR